MWHKEGPLGLRPPSGRCWMSRGVPHPAWLLGPHLCALVQLSRSLVSPSLLGAWHGPRALVWHPHGMATRPEASSRPPELLRNPVTAAQGASGSPLQAELRLGTRSVRSGHLPLCHFSVALVMRAIPRGSPLGVQMQSRHRPEWSLCHVSSSLPAFCLCCCEKGAGSRQYLDPSLYLPNLSKLLLPEGLPHFPGDRDSPGAHFFLHHM